MKTVEGFRTEDTDDVAGSVEGLVPTLPPLPLLISFLSLAWIPLSDITHTLESWTKSKVQ